MGNEKDRLEVLDITDAPVELNAVRARLVEHVRTKKGLPNPATQLELEALSELTDAEVIDNPLIETASGTLSAPLAKDSPAQITEVRVQKRIANLLVDADGLKELRRAA